MISRRKALQAGAGLAAATESTVVIVGGDMPHLVVAVLESMVDALGGFHVVALEVCLAHDGIVEHPHAVLADGAEGQFRLKRHTELAHHKHVERGAQCPGDLKGHRHAASRQAENDDVLTTERLETLRQLASSVDTIVKEFHLPSVKRRDSAPIWN